MANAGVPSLSRAVPDGMRPISVTSPVDKNGPHTWTGTASAHAALNPAAEPADVPCFDGGPKPLKPTVPVSWSQAEENASSPQSAALYAAPHAQHQLVLAPAGGGLSHPVTVGNSGGVLLGSATTQWRRLSATAGLNESATVQPREPAAITHPSTCDTDMAKTSLQQADDGTVASADSGARVAKDQVPIDPPLPIELHPLSDLDQQVLNGAVDVSAAPPEGCIMRTTGSSRAMRCSKVFGLFQVTRWCHVCKVQYEQEVLQRSYLTGADNQGDSKKRFKSLKKGSSDEGDGMCQTDSAAEASDSESKLPPGRRRKHICTAACHHVCATEGCDEMLTPAAARSRYIRCAKCRKMGIPTIGKGRKNGITTIPPTGGRKRSKRSENEENFDSGGNDADYEEEEITRRKGKRGKTNNKGQRGAKVESRNTIPVVQRKVTSPELTVSLKGRVRMPAKIFSPNQSPGVRGSATVGSRFNFDVDQNSTLLETPKRNKRELSKGSPRLGGSVWSPRSADGASSMDDDDAGVYSERVEPRIYVSPAPNWFVRPPVGADLKTVARMIATYRADMVQQKRTADDLFKRSPQPAQIVELPEEVITSDGDEAMKDSARIEDSSVDEPYKWLPSSKTSAAVSPIQVGSAASLDGNEPERSASVTIGVPHHSDVSSEGDQERISPEESDVPHHLRLAVQSTATEGAGAFDLSKCRKCQISDENDEADLITCTTCSMAFHAGCEEPALDWSPTEAFCSVICFDNFRNSAAGIELFKENMMLVTGHLRKYVNCFNNESLNQVVSRKSPVKGAHSWCHPQISIQEVHDIKPGQCVSLRAEPHADDPRIEWSAVIRHIFYHRSGYPLFYVTWLEPIRPDKSFYERLPCGVPQLVCCPSVSCPHRRGYANHHGYMCYSPTCRQRSQRNRCATASDSESASEQLMSEPEEVPKITAAAAPTSLMKVPSRLRIALSASELEAKNSDHGSEAEEAPKSADSSANVSSAASQDDRDSVDDAGGGNAVTQEMIVKQVEAPQILTQVDHVVHNNEDDGEGGKKDTGLNTGYFDSDRPQMYSVHPAAELGILDRVTVNSSVDEGIQGNFGDADKDEVILPSETESTASIGASNSKRAQKQSRSRSTNRGDVETKYGKNAIICTCGRVFANGQALGGHRGKCKVPRERAKTVRHDPENSRGAKRGSSSRNSSVERDVQGAPSRESNKRARRSQVDSESTKQRARQKPKPKRRTVPLAPPIRPVYPIRPFHPDNFKLGRNERRPQVPACIVKVHPFIYPDLPPTFFTMHRDFAKHRHSNAKIDELNPNTDAQLYGAVDEPELDPAQGFLEFGREAPRKLAFISPGIKMQDENVKSLGRTRSQTPTSEGKG